jgi:hypothetical protein
MAPSTTAASLTPQLRLRILSDLHLDQVTWTFTPAGEDLVVLAGDLCDRSRTGLRRRDRLFAEIADAGLSAIYVLGNHEAYDARRPLHQVVEDIRSSLPDHIRWLGPGATVDIHGVRFVGCTLWTDFPCTRGLLHNGTLLDHDTACRIAETEINDFRCIQAVAGRTGCTAQDLIGWHRAERAWLEQVIGSGYWPVVVVTHFLPSPESVAPRYRHDSITPYFVSDCRALMRPPVTTWIHGHTHTSCRYRHGGVEVVCNPRGYGNENPDFDPELVITVGGPADTAPR